MKELTSTVSLSLLCCTDIINKGLIVVLAASIKYKKLHEGPRHRLAFRLTVLSQSSFSIK